MDVPEKYQSADNLGYSLTKGYLSEFELVDKILWNRKNMIQLIKAATTTAGYLQNILKNTESNV